MSDQNRIEFELICIFGRQVILCLNFRNGLFELKKRMLRVAAVNENGLLDKRLDCTISWKSTLLVHEEMNDPIANADIDVYVPGSA